jgi:acetyl esterase/lipase
MPKPHPDFTGPVNARISSGPPGMPPGRLGMPPGPPPPADVSYIRNKHLDLAYANQSAAQKLDLYLPEEHKGPLPLIIYIHGGAFMICDKRDMQVVPHFVFLDHGYALASLNYRMSGEAIFPAAVLDCKCAIRWLRAHAKQYNLDPDRFAAIGGSAGGNLSAMLATSAGVEELEDKSQGNGEYSSAVQACVEWFGPTDFTKLDEQLAELELGPCDHNEANSPESMYMGGKITELDKTYVNKANPMTYINGNLPPIFIQHGSRDNLVPMLQSKIFVEEIERKLGPGRVVFEILEGAGHADPAFETTKNMIKAILFMDAHLK